MAREHKSSEANMTSTENGSAQQLGRIIERCRREIERRWLERVENALTHRPGIELTHLRDGLPDYLIELVRLFSRGGAQNFSSSAEPPWSKVAREHGVTRVRLGFDINQLISEFVILRQVIREVAAEHGVATPSSPDAVLADTLDAAIAAAVNAYVDARDYEARKREAENISFLTHELRNPLSTAMISASQLRRQAPAEYSRLLDALDRSHEKLSELIDSVLLAEKLEAGKVQPRLATLALSEVVEPALEAARTTAANKDLAFHVSYDHDLSVHLDPVLTRSALQNLADNAAKYTDHGEVTITIEQNRDALAFHVRDTCAGISEEELRTIFEPFERGTSGKSGTGIGLAIARRAVEAQGGSISAESPGAAGCHFWMTLPYSRSEE
jgi:signal transduction histidine kinase